MTFNRMIALSRINESDSVILRQENAVEFEVRSTQSQVSDCHKVKVIEFKSIGHRNYDAC